MPSSMRARPCLARHLCRDTARTRRLRRAAARPKASFGETEQLTVQIAAGEYLNHIAGGIPMNQGEFVRLADLGLDRAARPRACMTWR